MTIKLRAFFQFRLHPVRHQLVFEHERLVTKLAGTSTASGFSFCCFGAAGSTPLPRIDIKAKGARPVRSLCVFVLCPPHRIFYQFFGCP
jgi:hypothetical protein